MEQINKVTKMVPSGFTVDLKEQTGEDEDVLSRMGDIEEGISYTKFLSRIIVGSNLDNKKNFTTEEINEWPAVDKYFCLLESRIFSLGHKLDFVYKCQNDKCGKETNMDEDLRKYTHDLSEGNPSKTDPDYAYKPKLFKEPNTKTFYSTLSNGKEIKWDILTSSGELKNIKKNRDELNRSDEFRARNLAYKAESGEWVTISNFKMFTSRIMSELREKIRTKEFEWDLTMQCKCPHCSKIGELMILNVPTFFFPSGV